MKTYFTKKDLVKFGEYLLSDKRTELIKERGNDQLKERLKTVSHADICNFKDCNGKK